MVNYKYRKKHSKTRFTKKKGSPQMTSLSLLIATNTCDLCQGEFVDSDIYNVDYPDMTSNVACWDCVCGMEADDTLMDVWQS